MLRSSSVRFVTGNMKYYFWIVSLSLLFICTYYAHNAKAEIELSTTLNTTLNTTEQTTLNPFVEPTLNLTLHLKEKKTRKPKVKTSSKKKGKPTGNTTSTTMRPGMKDTQGLDTTLKPDQQVNAAQGTKGRPSQTNSTLNPKTKLNSLGLPLLTPELVRLIPTHQNTSEYVIVGRDVESEEIPFLVALEFTGAKASWFCAGTLLKHRWILTVASCTTDALRVKISYGASQRDNPDKQVYVGKRSMHQHPKYKKNYIHDIALIHAPYVRFTKRIGPLTVSHITPYPNTWIYTGGWGQHEDTKNFKVQFHQIRIQIMEKKYCMQWGYGKSFHANLLCARIPRLDTSCGIDSGSPLVVQSNYGLIGIAAYGSSANCRNNTLLGYTKLHAYNEWMNSVMSRYK